MPLHTGNLQIEKDLTLLQSQFAVFCLFDNKFYKLAVLDIRGGRFELWGDDKTRMVPFSKGVLFNYLTDEKIFEELYEKYVNLSGMKRIISKEDLIIWFKMSESQIRFMSDRIEKQEQIDKQRNSTRK